MFNGRPVKNPLRAVEESNLRRLFNMCLSQMAWITFSQGPHGNQWAGAATSEKRASKTRDVYMAYPLSSIRLPPATFPRRPQGSLVIWRENFKTAKTSEGITGTSKGFFLWMSSIYIPLAFCFRVYRSQNPNGLFCIELRIPALDSLRCLCWTSRMSEVLTSVDTQRHRMACPGCCFPESPLSRLLCPELSHALAAL